MAIPAGTSFRSRELFSLGTFSLLVPIMAFATLRKLLLRLGITGPVFILMVKGATPPTIALAMYRSPIVATVYGNFGFLIALTSILSLHLQSRARFLQNITLATLLTCLAGAVAILSHFAGLKARKHTENPQESPGTYNSSASVVNAIFFCIVLWLVSTLRAAWPQITIPFLICTIYAIVAITNGPEVRSEPSSLLLCKQLLFCYLTGFGLSMAVSFLFFPKTSRMIFLENSHRFLLQCRNLLQEEHGMLKNMGKSSDAAQEKQAIVVKISAMRLLGAMSSLRDELSYAKQEFAFGIHTYGDLESLLHGMEGMLIPLLGLSKITSFSILSAQTDKRSNPFGKLVGATMASFKNVIDGVESEIQHTSMLLRANKLFATRAAIRADLDQFEKGEEYESPAVIELARNDLACKLVNRNQDGGAKDYHENRGPQLLGEVEEYLYILCLLRSGSVAIQDLSALTRSQLKKAVSQRWRLILPLMADMSLFAARSKSSYALDPEYLPPHNSFEKFGNLLRESLSVLGSDSSKFGFRIVAATMSIGIMAFLKSTQHFFVEYRLVWAMVMIPISMSPTAGTAIYGFIGRGLGVAAAMLLAYVNWYIVDGKPAGVIVMFFVCMMVYYFLLLKYPRFIVLFILAAANHVLIIGYELQQSVKIPVPVVSPQRYFPVYILAPYRLLNVLAALFVAFIFTIFPAQISEHKILRQKVASSIALLASYSSSVSTTLDQRIRGTEGDTTQSSSPGRMLKARRIDILFKELALLTQMRQISTMVPWEVSLGGKFPKRSYDILVDEIQSAVASLSVIAYISQAFPTFGKLPSNKLIQDAYSPSLFHPTSNEIVTTLSLLALSLSAGNQLTPRTEILPETYQQPFLQRAIDGLGEDALRDPNFEAFLVVEVAGAQVVRSLETMVNTVRELVGTMDFSEPLHTDTSMDIV